MARIMAAVSGSIMVMSFSRGGAGPIDQRAGGRGCAALGTWSHSWRAVAVSSPRRCDQRRLARRQRAQSDAPRATRWSRAPHPLHPPGTGEVRGRGPVPMGAAGGTGRIMRVRLQSAPRARRRPRCTRRRAVRAPSQTLATRRAPSLQSGARRAVTRTGRRSAW